MHYLGVDLGGTNIVAAVLDENYNIISQSKCSTNCPRSYQQILTDVAKVALDASAKVSLNIKDFAYCGIGSPGIISIQKGIIADAVNLGFKNVPAAQFLSDKLGIPIILENDANAAAYGEFIAGSAKGKNNFVALTIGTGIGSGVILDKKIYRGTNGLGGELGHTVINFNGRQCSCGRKGCMDVYASATGLITSTKDAMKANKNSIMWQMTKNDLATVNGMTAFVAARKEDESAKSVVAEYVEVLAICITNIVNTFQPDMISIAGGISREGEYLLEPVRKQVYSQCLKTDFLPLPELCMSKLQDNAGVIGAALLGVS